MADEDVTFTTAQLLTKIISITPTANRTLTLPTAANAVTVITGVKVGNSIDFTIINESTPINQASVIITVGTGGSFIGSDTVHPVQNLSETYFTSGSGTFRMRFTNITTSFEAYDVYRIS